MKISELAGVYAQAAHAAMGQKRKYTGECYFTHPKAVASIVSQVSDNDLMVAAAYLHDVVEDTNITINHIHTTFGISVAEMVSGLTDVSKLENGTRAIRKALDRDHTASQTPDTKTIKLADLIHNSYSIERYDPKFAKIYMDETRQLLEVLKEGSPILYNRASDIVEAYYEKIGIRL